MATNYRTTIQIRRPSGEVETVDVSAKFPIGLDAKTFAAIRQNTRAAGRGEALSYEMVDLIGAEKRAAAAAAVAAQSAKEFANSTAGREAASSATIAKSIPMKSINLGSYSITIARDNTGQPAAYVNDSSESSSSGEEAILASFLQDARNAGAEDALYAALAASQAAAALG